MPVVQCSERDINQPRSPQCGAGSQYIHTVLVRDSGICQADGELSFKVLYILFLLIQYILYPAFFACETLRWPSVSVNQQLTGR